MGRGRRNQARTDRQDASSTPLVRFYGLYARVPPPWLTCAVGGWGNIGIVVHPGKRDQRHIMAPRRVPRTEATGKRRSRLRNARLRNPIPSICGAAQAPENRELPFGCWSSVCRIAVAWAPFWRGISKEIPVPRTDVEPPIWGANGRDTRSPRRSRPGVEIWAASRKLETTFGDVFP